MLVRLIYGKHFFNHSLFQTVGQAKVILFLEEKKYMVNNVCASYRKSITLIVPNCKISKNYFVSSRKKYIIVNNVCANYRESITLIVSNCKKSLSYFVFLRKKSIIVNNVSRITKNLSHSLIQTVK